MYSFHKRTYHVQSRLRNSSFQRTRFPWTAFVVFEDQVQQCGHVFLKTLIQCRLLHQTSRFQPSRPKRLETKIIGIDVDYAHSGHSGRSCVRQVTDFKQHIAPRFYPIKCYRGLEACNLKTYYYVQKSFKP